MSEPTTRQRRDGGTGRSRARKPLTPVPKPERLASLQDESRETRASTSEKFGFRAKTMEKKGIELLEKAPPSKLKQTIVATTKKVGLPLAIAIQLIFLTLLGFYFKLNWDLNALSASIDEKETVLEQGKELETLFRRTQNKLETIAAVKEDFCYPCALKILGKITPALVNFNTVIIEGEKLSIVAETFHGPSLALFVANLLEEKAIKEVVITSGSLSEDGRFNFTMELWFNKAEVTQND
ncbi:hypothetical protein COT70_00305 [candidate division WWE3 bacterium CG09_land_8_20_14_0_10_47_33]|nr:MAG: hypothetical protein COT70_00305 [candidate division WWE3 bacterium CG09_land_8_20_14_0_10_47_33]PJE51635.1 MAG: hypothetical protein COV28_02105 [candidate division WWE3 bacterium CG10_big_fil_rev_8_21_14_0_10_48_23]